VKEGEVMIAVNSTAFCEICQHSVYDMDKHVRTDDHKRNARRANGGFSRKPRFPTGVARAATGAKY